MNLDLDQHRVMISGAASGIGSSTVRMFAEEGAVVCAVDIDEARLHEVGAELADLGKKIVVVVADLSTAEGCEHAITESVKKLGGLDTVVNNVGAGTVRNFEEISDEDWWATLNLNFMSYVRLSRAVLPILRRSKRFPSIINNASDLAKQPEAVPIDYSVSKAAVLALSKGLARAEGPTVRVNAVAPGPIWTPFWSQPGGFADSLARFHDMEPQAAVEFEMKQRQLPLARLGTPEEVANVITFLASSRASFVTGSVWGIDGGSIRSIY